MPGLSTRSRIFLWLSLILALSDAVFVWINHRAEQANFQNHLNQRAQYLRDLFEVELDNTAIRMQQTGTFVASMPEVQAAFHAGRLAVEAEGGGAGGAKAEQTRQHLLDLVNTPWQELRTNYDTRQLHFQFGDKATSFLRVHATDRYGDKLEGVRHSIFDAIQQRKATAGFECGRIICGIRGVAPVFLSGRHTSSSEFIGVLEAGTSFQKLLELLEKPSQAKFAVLLSMPHLSETFFPDKLADLVRNNPPVNGNFVEATLHPEVRDFLLVPEIERLVEHSGTTWLKLDGRYLAFTVFPLRDYLGHKNGDRPPVGTVLAWVDVKDDIQKLNADLVTNVTYAIIVFLLIEILLFQALRMATSRLESIIDMQTAALHQKAVHDELTGLYNRHYLDEFIHKEYARATRHQRTLSLAMMDLDHFKGINDKHGHLVGDHVLTEAAHLVRDHLRASDLTFRYGGEEFLLVFTDTSLDEAMAICENLRRHLESSAIADLAQGQVTASFGVTQMTLDGEDLETLLVRADEALYRAKAHGRNRVESGPDVS